MKRNLVKFIKLLILTSVTVLLTVFLYKTFHNVFKISDEYRDIPKPPTAGRHRQDAHPKHGAFFSGEPKNEKMIKIDWHDYKYIDFEKRRRGIGEHGEAAHTDPKDEKERKRLFSQNGFNGLLSDNIALNRSVKDIRHKGCKDIRYLSELPTVSVVVPFFDEHWSTLLRTCYSVLNRSPAELIVEIILVDDHSTKEFLKEKLDNYIALNLPKVKVVRLPERSGLIAARIAGAKVATGDVLIFLDSHTEANTNWLPPLLEPIALNYKVCVCPFIDVIAYDTFEYRAQDEGARGAFDWQFYYKRLPLLPDDLAHPTRPFKSPVMAGGLFAISAKFFWELGGYDSGLDIWGGEQYELSFKIWQCGGEMYDAPCSRVGHIYRGSVPFSNPRKNDYLHKNYKRVAEVWMDEYAQYLYKRSPEVYKHVDVGDISQQLAIREKLQCKPFKWFMEEVAFDLPKKYPPIEPPDFASGFIRSVTHPNLCADTLNKGVKGRVGLFSCGSDPELHLNQRFKLSWHKDIRSHKSHCWDVPGAEKNAEIIFYDCHGGGGNQEWRYDIKKKWIIQGRNRRCLDCDPVKKTLFVNTCDESNDNMKWEFSVVNEEAMKNFDNIGPS